MLWNTVGSVFYLACQWFLSVVVVRVGSYADAGILSLAMSITNIFATIALFNVRNFQVSDSDGEYTNGEYVFHRHLTCIGSLVLCAVFVLANQYNALTGASIIFYMLVRIVEAYADVYHGIAQKSWRLDIAGKSFVLRGILLLGVFTLTHIFFSNIAISLFAVSLTSIISLFLYDHIAVKRISPFKIKATRLQMVKLSVKCLPLLVYGICTNAIVSSARYLIELYHGEETLGYYATVSTIAVLVQTFVTLIFTPLIGVFNEAVRTNDIKKLTKLLLGLIAFTAVITLVAMLAIYLLGDFAMSLLFGEQILPYTYLLYPTVLASSLMALVWLFGMLLIVIRDFITLMCGAILGFIASLTLSICLIPSTVYDGANISVIVSLGVICAIYFVRIIIYIFKNKCNVSKGV